MQPPTAVRILTPGDRTASPPGLPLAAGTAVAVLLFLFLVLPVHAAEYTVSPSGGNFSTIQDAISYAGRGDTILVESGTYNETVRIDKGLIVRGIDRGGGSPVILPDKDGDAVEIASNGCTFSGFVIQNARMLSGIRITTDNNTVTGNTVVAGSQGILLDTANYNLIAGNNVSRNIRSGISLTGSAYNRIENNTVNANSIGITLDEYSVSNQIIRNNFFNIVNVVSKSATSLWDSGTVLQYRYLGRNQTGRMGNYWSNYQGSDGNRDGIGDTPYVIQIGAIKTAVLSFNQDTADSYPLMDPKEYYAGVTESALRSPASAGPAGDLQPGGQVTEFLLPGNGSAGLLIPNGNGGLTNLLPLVVLAVFLAIMVTAAMAFRGKGWHSSGEPAAAGDAAAHGAAPMHEPPATVPDSLARPNGSATVMAGDGGAGRPVPAASAALTRPSGATTVPSEGESSPPAMAAPSSYFPPELGGKYTDIHLIGRGGIAWVYSAVRRSDGMKVAVKIPISFDEMTGQSFLNEIKAWEMLRHPNIIEITAVNILPVPYVEMEYVPGALEPVAEPIPVRKAVHIVRGIADALRYAHSLGIIHRDIKPHNILITHDLTPKITDWGMSKAMATDGKKSSIAGFSLSYAAPEQVSPAEFGRTDARTDLYQLGVLFYELVTGTLPFGGESIVEVCNAILKETPKKPSEFNPEAAAIDHIILKCLEKDPAKRFQAAFELLAALDECCREAQ